MKRCSVIIALAMLLSAMTAPVARAQATSSEALAAAKELISVMHLDDQLAAMLPNILKNLKPTIVQGRAEVAIEYDALVPRLMQAFQGRMSELLEAVAVVYARNLSAEDLHALTEFYRSPTGQRVLKKQPSIAQESTIAGQKLGQSISEEIRKQMVEELRKKGLDL